MKTASVSTWILLGVFFVIFIFFSRLIGFVTDWWWFGEVGFTQIFLKSLAAKVIIGFLAGFAAAVFLLGNFLIAVRSKVPWMATIPEALVGQSISLDDRKVKQLGVVINLLAALLIALITAASWHDVLKFLAAVPFGQTDPLFGKDVAFYVFSLPVYTLGLGLFRALILLSLATCTAVYVLRGSLSLSKLFGKFGFDRLIEKLGSPLAKLVKAKNADNKARLHIAVLLFLFLITIAANSYLSLFNLLTGQSGPVFGAAFTDANIMVPILRVSVFAYGLTALLALFYGISGRVAPLFGAISFTILIGLAQVVIPAIFQKLVVAPNELTKESPFIKK